MIKPQQLLRDSITQELTNEILEIQKFYAKKEIPAFIRVEGGMVRKLFISSDITYLQYQNIDNSYPIEQINRLNTSDNKFYLLDIFNRLQPGCCLIVHDSDSCELQDRIVDWFIVSISK